MTLLFQNINKLIILLFLSLFSCSKLWQTNEEYLDYISSIVIQYQTKHGQIPEILDEAIQESRATLFNRGDSNGNPLRYVPLSPSSFMLRSYGKNKKDNKGLSDDLDVYFVDKKKVDRKQFIIEINRNPLFKEAYSDLFDSKFLYIDK